MNKRSMLTLVALCVAGPLAAQTPPPPPAPKVPARVVAPPVVVPPVVVPSIDLPPIAPMMFDAQHALEMARPQLDAARMALQDLDLSHLNLDLNLDLQGMAPAL